MYGKARAIQAVALAQVTRGTTLAKLLYLKMFKVQNDAATEWSPPLPHGRTVPPEGSLRRLSSQAAETQLTAMASSSVVLWSSAWREISS